MIDNALIFLKEQLNSYIRLKTNSSENQVVFAEHNNIEQIVFPDDTITVLLINLEEERTFKSGAVYDSGSQFQGNPNLSLNLYTLFVSKFANYNDSLKYLSLTINFFNSYRVFESQKFPSLSPEIEKLAMEMVNIPLHQQRDIWSILKTFYTPSILYKARMIVFRDRESIDLSSEIVDTQTATSKM